MEFAHVKNQEGTIQKLKEQLKSLEDELEGRTAVSGGYVEECSVGLHTLSLCRLESVRNQLNLLQPLKRKRSQY